MQGGTQAGSWECGYYTLQNITCAGADCVTPLTPTDIDNMKQLLAGDLMAQRVTTTAGIQAGPRFPSPEASGSRAPSGSRATDSRASRVMRTSGWTMDGARIRIAEPYRPYTKKRRATKKAVPDPKQPVDVPATEHVLLDGEEGLSLQILSLNLGISCFKGSVEQIAVLLLKPQFKHVAVLHLQEAA
jgi:hypothetical protein